MIRGPRSRHAGVSHHAHRFLQVTAHPGRDPGGLRVRRRAAAAASRPAGRTPARASRRAARRPSARAASSPSARPRRRRASSSSAGATPPRPVAGVGSSSDDLQQHLEPTAGLVARRSRALGPGRAGPRSARRRRTARRSAALLRCSWPTKCHRGARSRRHSNAAASSTFAAASWSRFSPTSRTPRSTSAATSDGRERLGHHDERHLGRVPPGASAQASSIRERTRASRSASSSRRGASGVARVRLPGGPQPGDAGEPAGPAVATVGVERGRLPGAAGQLPRRHAQAGRAGPAPRQRRPAPACRSRSAPGWPAATRPPARAAPAAPRSSARRPTGPSRASIRPAPRSRMAATAAGTTPAAMPGPAGVGDRDDARRPGRRAAPGRSPRPGRRAPGRARGDQRVGVRRPRRDHGPSTTHDVAPWTWLAITSRSAARPSAAATAAGSRSTRPGRRRRARPG